MVIKKYQKIMDNLIPANLKFFALCRPEMGITLTDNNTGKVFGEWNKKQ